MIMRNFTFFDKSRTKCFSYLLIITFVTVWWASKENIFLPNLCLLGIVKVNEATTTVYSDSSHCFLAFLNFCRLRRSILRTVLSVSPHKICVIYVKICKFKSICSVPIWCVESEQKCKLIVLTALGYQMLILTIQLLVALNFLRQQSPNLIIGSN